MKVLVLTITTGQGHNQVAKNLEKAIVEGTGGEAQVLDVFEYINQGLKEVVSRGYLFSAKRMPRMYGKAYSMAENRDSDGYIMGATTAIMAKKLLKFVEEYAPDVIVCTHVFAAMIVGDIERKFTSAIHTIGVVTDFTIHPFWEDTKLDYYITANPYLTNQAIKKGISGEKVLPLGIPIDPVFAHKTEKTAARQILGIDDCRTILVMSGSMGYGKVEKVVRQLDLSDIDFQIISVCGNNERLKRRIDRFKSRHKIYNYGFTDKVSLMMDASDCIVTKPGGITSSEALAKGLPMIIANPIPGQEDRNVEFLMNNGAAVKVSTTFPADEAVYHLFKNPTRLKNIQDIARELGKPNSMQDLVELIATLGKIGEDR